MQITLDLKMIRKVVMVNKQRFALFFLLISFFSASLIGMEPGDFAAKTPTIDDLPIDCIGLICGHFDNPKDLFDVSMLSRTIHEGARECFAVLRFRLPHDEEKRLRACRHWCLFFGVPCEDDEEGGHAWHTPNRCSLEICCFELSDFQPPRKDLFSDKVIMDSCKPLAENVSALTLHGLKGVSGRCLSIFPELRRLEVSDGKLFFDPENFHHVPNLEELEVLALRRVQDRHLMKLGKLRKLRLYLCKGVSGEAFGHMPALRSLKLDCCSIDGGKIDFGHLKEISTLKKLYVKDGPWRPFLDRHLEGLDLVEVVLEGNVATFFDGDSLKNMPSLKRVRFLEILDHTASSSEELFEELRERGVDVFVKPFRHRCLLVDFLDFDRDIPTDLSSDFGFGRIDLDNVDLEASQERKGEDWQRD